jgi:hypothetical protein
MRLDSLRALQPRKQPVQVDLLIYYIVGPLTYLFPPYDVKTRIRAAIGAPWKVVTVQITGTFLIHHGQHTVRVFLHARNLLDLL